MWSVLIIIVVGVLLFLSSVTANSLSVLNWPLLSTMVLGFALLAFFYRFERRGAKTIEVALLATLGALAAAVRVPFVALINVQPTTFLVMLAGYVFGVEAGFMVGAVAALVSNFFLGQGPWTPWQMFAWGLGGVVAGLWGRGQQGFSLWAFALLAGCWGLVFGWIMNIWHWVGFIYPLTWGTFLTTYAISFPFDIFHAVGNVIFTLVFGPSFYGFLSRFRARLLVSRR